MASDDELLRHRMLRKARARYPAIVPVLEKCQFHLNEENNLVVIMLLASKREHAEALSDVRIQQYLQGMVNDVVGRAVNVAIQVEIEEVPADPTRVSYHDSDKTPFAKPTAGCPIGQRVDIDIWECLACGAQVTGEALAAGDRQKLIGKSNPVEEALKIKCPDYVLVLPADLDGF